MEHAAQMEPEEQRPPADTPFAGQRQAVDRYRLVEAGLLAVRLGPLLVLLILIGIVAATTPVFRTSDNLGNVLSQTSVISILALGQLLVIITRGIDLSVGSTIALSSVVGAIVYRDGHHSFVLVTAAILATGVCVGLFNGVAYVFGRIPHPFIVTLATLSAVRGIALWAANGTLIFGMPSSVHSVGSNRIWAIPYASFVVLGLALLVLALTTKLVWGRWLYAVGGNPDGARRAGIPVNRVLVTVYVLSGLAAGFGGLLTAGLTNSGSPNYGELAELDSIAAVIIGGAAFAGGRGNVGNALVGALTIGVIRNALNLHNVDAFVQLVVIGAVILLAVEADVIRGRLENRFRVVQTARHG
jgi:ribose transport system permease protein